MPKGGWLHCETHLFPLPRPASVRQWMIKPPLAAAILIRPGHKFPRCIPIGLRRGPERLWFGPDETMWAITFQLTTMSRINQAIIRPSVTNQGNGCHTAGVARSAT